MFTLIQLFESRLDIILPYTLINFNKFIQLCKVNNHPSVVYAMHLLIYMYIANVTMLHWPYNLFLQNEATQLQYRGSCSRSYEK